MNDQLLRGLTIASAVGAAVSGGVFFAFSTFIMRALDDLAPADGIAAMQSINRAAPNPLFITVLFGTGLTSAALMANAARHLDEPGAGLRLLGGALFMVAIVLTVAYHIPRNNALERLDATSLEAPREWARYVSGWTAWNHVRTLAPVASAVTLILSLGHR
jgi:uncharacterized membrane protein